MNTCKDCRFWHQQFPEGGECRRYAPQRGPWATTYASHWCGEHESKEAPAPTAATPTTKPMPYTPTHTTGEGISCNHEWRSVGLGTYDRCTKCGATVHN